MGWGESAATDICGYEARAVEMCVLNIDLRKRPTKIRYKNINVSFFSTSLVSTAITWVLFPALLTSKAADTVLLSNL